MSGRRLEFQPADRLTDIGQLNILPAIFDSILIPSAVALEIAPSIPDLPARRIARTLNLTVTGTVGVLLVAKRHGVIERVRPSLDALVTEGFFVGAELYDEILHLAGEFHQ